MEARQIIEQIEKNSYAVVEYDVPRELIEEGMKNFFEFCKLPDEIKDSFFEDPQLNYEDGSPGNYGDDKGIVGGFVHKKKKAGAYDDKEYFHVSVNIVKKFENGEYELDEVSERFLKSARELYKKLIVPFHDTIKTLDQEIHGIYNWVFEDDPLKSNCVLRFLKYSTSKKGDFIAKGHYDKGVATFAIAESHPGLRIGKTHEDLKDLEHKEGQALFFPAINMQDLGPQALKPSWHDVIQKENKDNVITTRWALVFFINPLFLRKSPSFEDTHTSY